VKNSRAVLTGALEAVFVVRSLPVRVAELASLGGAPSLLKVIIPWRKSEKNSTAVSGVLQFGRRCVNEEDNLNALFCPVQSKNKAIRKSFNKLWCLIVWYL